MKISNDGLSSCMQENGIRTLEKKVKKMNQGK